jgi:tRNA(Phe) wybutosine-synthesizing methylase Tyw3
MKKIIAALAIAVIPITIATPAQAATVEPYFLKLSTFSNHTINVWSTSSCGGSVHVVHTGEQIKSDGWDCARSLYDWDESIYDNKTGKWLADRQHNAFDAVPLSNNRHFVYVHNS